MRSELTARWRPLAARWLALVLLLAAGGCERARLPEREPLMPLPARSQPPQRLVPETVTAPVAGGEVAATVRRIRRGGPPAAPIAPAEAAADYRLVGETEVELGLVDAGIPAAAQAVLGEILGLSYGIDPRVEGSITIQTSGAMRKTDLLDTFTRLLELNGATLVTDGAKRTIVPLADAPVRLVTDLRAIGAGRQVVVVPLRFIAAAQMARMLQPFAGERALLHVDPQRNILLVAGTRAEIGTILDAVALFDVDQMQGQSVALVPLRQADPQAVADELAQVFDLGPGGTQAHLLRVVPNQRLRALLLIAGDERYLGEAEAWIAELDRQTGVGDRQLFVHKLQNRSAEELAPLLQRLLAEGNGGDGDLAAASTAPTRPTGLAPATLARQGGGATGGGSLATGQVTPAAPAEIAGEAGATGTRVVADSGGNAILVYASGEEDQRIGRIIAQLDTMPTQVLIEATIAEVTLTDELRYGVRWFLERAGLGLTFSDAPNGAVGPAFPGFSLLFSAGDSILALNALASITDVDVISSPSLMVQDNRQAVLQIGDEVPVVSQSATSLNDPDAVIVNAIEFRDTGVILSVLPRVSDGGRVSLEIGQEVSDVVATTTSGIDSPTIRQRRVTTSVVVGDGETLTLGGLIQDRSNRTRAQVPLLGDIPVLGSLFRRRDDSGGRTELLVLITPRVVRDANEARRVTEEFRQRMRVPVLPE